MALNDPVLAAKDYINTLLREAASDLRTNNRDLRLILGIMEKDVARLQTSLESEKATNASGRASSGLNSRRQTSRKAE
jgi:hypothetical protein